MNFTRCIAAIFLVFASIFTISAQLTKPISYKLTASSYSVKKGDVVELTLTIVPQPGWHIYSEKSTCPADDRSTLSELNFMGNNFTLLGSFYGVGAKMEKDDVSATDCQTGVFHGNAVFKQKVKVTADVMDLVCDYQGQMCKASCVQIPQKVKLDRPIRIAEDGKTVAADTASTATSEDTAKVKAAKTVDTLSSLSQIKHSYKTEDPAKFGNCKGIAGETENKGLWAIFLLALGSGFLALITPCVFPMIPMTVSFFIKNNDRKKAIRDGLIFATSIIAIYVILGTVVSVVFKSAAPNWLSTHWLPNTFFFAIFVVFAASFFGAFEIVLPSSWINKMDKQADKGGWAGPVFMAATIALVSFSCTGPIVGSVLVEASKGGIIKAVIAMLGFSLAFALPFGLLVIFPTYLKSLPKSGGWLNSVKVVLGFIELAFALKFLSVADQTYHWGLLDREVYLVLWIVIFGLMGLYLLGKIKFSHDSDLKFLSVPRLMFAIASLAFTVYLIPGLWGAPLNALAGYLPPLATQDFKLGDHGGDLKAAPCGTAKYSDKLEIEHNISGYFDYDEALACAKQTNKPIFIDFTGHGCVNCRKMEQKAWVHPEALKRLKDSFIVVSLYVDDKVIDLANNESFYAQTDGHKVTKLGDKNTVIQECYFNSNSQPQYIIMDQHQRLMHKPTSAEDFNYNGEKFAEFLKKGLQQFNKLK